MRRLPLALLAGLTLLAPPAAAAPPAGSDERCDGAVPAEPDARRARLDRLVASRRDYTFRADRAFVARLQRSREARRRGARHGFPGGLTAAEARYFAVVRPRVENAASRLRPFERRHRSILGGTSIEDDFRGGPFLKVRLTVAKPRRFVPRLRRLTGVRVRVVRVRYSERELSRVQDRVDGLFDAPPLGVDVVATSVDIDASRVDVLVATRRTDVQAELRQRFGPAVRVIVGAAESTGLVCSRLERVAVAADDQALELRWSGSSSFEPERAVVEEGPDTVRVGVLERGPTIGIVNADLQAKALPVRLAAPLGGRRLIDAETGRPLRVVRP